MTNPIFVTVAIEAAQEKNKQAYSKYEEWCATLRVAPAPFDIWLNITNQIYHSHLQY